MLITRLLQEVAMPRPRLSSWAEAADYCTVMFGASSGA